MRELHLVSAEGPSLDWVQAVNSAAGRDLATVYDFDSELFPFAADFADGDGFLVGKLPDGTQLFAYAGPSDGTAHGWFFAADGAPLRPLELAFPAELVAPSRADPDEGWEAHWQRERQAVAARRDYLGQLLGFRPAFIRVEGFSLDAAGLAGPGRYDFRAEEAWGRDDVYDEDPELADQPGGNGEIVFNAVRNGSFTFDFGNEWWCDRTGHVTAT